MAGDSIFSAQPNAQKHGVITRLLKTVTSPLKRSETSQSDTKATLTTLQEEVWQNSEKLNHPGLRDEDRQELREELQMDRAALKTDLASEPHFQKMTQGKTKQVWHHTADHQHAYFTPMKGTFDRV